MVNDDLFDCWSGISVGMVLSNYPFFQAFDHMAISFFFFFGDLILVRSAHYSPKILKVSYISYIAAQTHTFASL